MSARKAASMKPATKRGADPVSMYLRERLKGLVGTEPGQMQNQVAAEKIGIAASGLSQFISGHTRTVRPDNYAAYAKFLGFKGSDETASQSLVRDAGEWYRSLVGGKMPLLDEPAVRAAIELVSSSQGISPKVVESLLVPFSNSTFLGRDTSFWVQILTMELRYCPSQSVASNGS